jgi:antirestriction protein ArdC
MTNDAFVKNVASQLIEQIRRGTAPWQKPWEPGTSFLPFNPTNGTRYKGINVVNLLSRGYGDARWMTYRQAQTKGYQVRRGEKEHLWQTGTWVSWRWRGPPITSGDGGLRHNRHSSGSLLRLWGN